MQIRNSKFHRRALMVFNQLPEEEQTQVLAAFASLASAPSAEWPTAEVKKLPGDQALYLVRVNDSLRALVQAAAGQQPEVIDLVRHETLESFGKAAATNGA